MHTTARRDYAFIGDYVDITFSGRKNYKRRVVLRCAVSQMIGIEIVTELKTQEQKGETFRKM